MNTDPELYAGKVRTITRIGRYYYGLSLINGAYYTCMQEVGDKGWLVKEEKFKDLTEALNNIKSIEKEHYSDLKLKAGT